MKVVQLMEFKQNIGEFQSLGHLKTHLTYLSNLLDEKDREILTQNHDMQRVQISNEKLAVENDERTKCQN